MNKLISIAVAAGLLTACSGGGGTTPQGAAVAPVAPVSGARAIASFRLRLPARTTSPTDAKRRRPLYVSLSTASLVVTLTAQNGVTLSPSQSYALNITSGGNCVTAGNITTCTLAVPAQVGVDTFTVATYDAAQASATPTTLIGNVLSSTVTTTTVVANTANMVSLTLGGVVHGLAISFSNPTPPEGTPATIGLIVTATDAGGNTIIGSGAYASPITLANTDTSGATTLSTTAVTSPSTVVNIAYTGAPTGATFSASAPSISPVSAALDTQGVGAWATRAPLPTAEYEFGAVAAGGLLYAIAGDSGTGGLLNTVEAYDPVANTWTTKSPIPTARKSLRAAAVNGIIYAIGGYLSGTSSIATVEAYDTVADTWATKASMPTARQDLAVAVAGGKIYAIGGVGSVIGPQILGAVEAYDPATNTWTAKASMPSARFNLTATTYNNKIYAIGGESSSSAATSTVQVYDTVADSWSTASAADPTARYGSAGGLLRTKVYVSGGGYNTPTNVTEAYDPVANTWATKAAMSLPRTLSGSDVINGILYVAGGTQAGSTSSNALQAYTP